MEDNNLKEKVQKNVKEKIAVSNIREEFDMHSNKTKKKVYWVLSSCAVFVLAFGIIISVNISNSQEKNSDHVVAEMQQNAQEENLETNNNSNSFAADSNRNEQSNQEQNSQTNTLDNKKDNDNDSVVVSHQSEQDKTLEVDLKINKAKDMMVASLDADIENIKIDNLPEKFKFINNINVPSGYKLESSYNVYTRKDINIEEYNLLHDYVFSYRKDEVNDITIAFSEVEKPLRDYYIDGGDKISKIGDVELIISQYKEMYIVTFNINGLYFDIETEGITEKQLSDLLVSIINGVNTN